jgi:hypothetical protein
MLSSVFAIFSDPDAAEKAIDNLNRQGFTETEIYVVLRRDEVDDITERSEHKEAGEVLEEEGDLETGRRARVGVPTAIIPGFVHANFRGGQSISLLTIGGQKAPTGASADAMGPLLEELEISKEAAAPYIEAVDNGQTLLVVRTEQPRATIATNVLRTHQGEQVRSFEHRVIS